MESFVKMVRSNIVVQAVLFLALGLFLIFMPGVTVTTVIYLMGALLGLSGVASLVSYFRPNGPHTREPGVLMTGVFLLVCALIVFLFPQVIASFFSVALGIVLVLCGVVNAVRAVELRGLDSYSWIVALVISVLIAIGGVVIIWNPFESTVTFIMVLGVLLAVNGAADLLIEWRSREELKHAHA
ncbi:MAG: hypothetical protein HFJ75_10340 [Eggerthellaceae bacterium]|nr:hypothetical protein [Eggerthellaceae bacterium]